MIFRPGNLWFLMPVVLLVSCSGPDNKQTAVIPAVVPAKESRYATTLAKFSPVTNDTLRIESNPDSNGEFTAPYKGIRLDSNDRTLFAASKLDVSDPTEFFAIYQLAMDSDHVALIARTPSEYLTSSIKLFIFDRQKDRITSFTTLADTFGDGGDYTVTESWLFKNSNGSLHQLLYINDGHDNSAEDPTNKTVDEYHQYALLNLSGSITDTINNDSVFLKKKFEHLLRK